MSRINLNMRDKNTVSHMLESSDQVFGEKLKELLAENDFFSAILLATDGCSINEYDSFLRILISTFGINYLMNSFETTIPEIFIEGIDFDVDGDSNYMLCIEIPDHIKTIDKKAFRNSQIAAIYIPKSVKIIADNAFFANKTQLYFEAESLDDIDLIALNSSSRDNLSFKDPYTNTKRTYNFGVTKEEFESIVHKENILE